MKLSMEGTASPPTGKLPPLSQSRHGGMACEALYIRKHIDCARIAESDPAARGIESIALLDLGA